MGEENQLSEDKSRKLMSILPAFLLINPQSEAVMINLQKLADEMSDESRTKLYELVKKDLIARTKRQIAMLNEQIARM